MRTFVRMLPLGLVTLVAAVAVTGCGGGGGAALDPVARAAENTSEAGSFRFDFSVSVGFAFGDEKQTVEVAGDGAYDGGSRRFAGKLEVDGDTIEAILDGGAKTVYVKPPAGEADLPDGKTWLKLDIDDAAKSGGLDLGGASAEQLDPKQAVEMLKDAGESTKVGEEEIDGVETTHYRVVVDTAKALESQPQEQREQGEKALGMIGVATLPLDVWVDGDGYLRRVSAEVGGDDKLFSLQLRFDVSDYGADVGVDLPPADEVADGAQFIPAMPPTTTS